MTIQETHLLCKKLNLFNIIPPWQKLTVFEGRLGTSCILSLVLKAYTIYRRLIAFYKIVNK